MEVVEKKNFVSPSPRPNTLKDKITYIQEDRWPATAFPTLKIQREDAKDIEKTARRVYSYALACSWATSALMMITAGVFLILAFLLLRSATQKDGVALIKTTMGRCITDKEGTCFSKFQEDFFSYRKTVEKYWLSCYISEFKDEGLVPISELQLPLFSDNPILLIIATLFTVIAYWILGCIYDLLIDVTTTAAPQLSSRRA